MLGSGPRETKLIRTLTEPFILSLVVLLLSRSSHRSCIDRAVHLPVNEH